MESRESAFDCFILTQTLQFIYDVRGAVEQSHRLLRPGGVVLVTLPVLSRLGPEHGLEPEFWRFTTASGALLFSERFGAEHVSSAATGT